MLIDKARDEMITEDFQPESSSMFNYASARYKATGGGETVVSRNARSEDMTGAMPSSRGAERHGKIWVKFPDDVNDEAFTRAMLSRKERTAADGFNDVLWMANMQPENGSIVFYVSRPRWNKSGWSTASSAKSTTCEKPVIRTTANMTTTISMQRWKALYAMSLGESHPAVEWSVEEAIATTAISAHGATIIAVISRYVFYWSAKPLTRLTRLQCAYFRKACTML
jgi:hypothetical protein